ncbi:MAG: outer membrane beta-barrel protein [Opitutus sp.]|nr:outer membrane beta-barrel protein [Opitutus sp.]MCS6246425.1 outer membrane beta-barrel protein [Opitutus sp.]MCS6273694.1 outer membrane beta-barrel protein [Opitutus sp.]MCS6277941.1 outer membrane beta-barrel protein [Opitutus sp.]MCS6298952.1 outer membrane beta-barrel protein [Opitutus sp.]
MKKTVQHLVILGGMGSAVFAAPFLAIGDNAELFATANSSVAYNDNLLLGRDGSELTDTVFVVTPGFDLKYGKDSAVSGDVFANSTLSSYADNVKLNNQLFATGATAAYASERAKLNANLSFAELDQPTADNAAATATQGTLLEHHDTAAGINGELRYSEKISFGSGVSYASNDYKSSTSTEQKSYSVPVNVYYELTPKVDVSTGLTYTHTELSGNIGAGNPDLFDAYYYNVGTRGTFTPKLSGSFSVGYNTRNGNVGQDEDGSVGSKASLAYAYSEKTQLTLGFNRDFANSTSGGNSYETTDLTLGASSAITVDWRLSAGLTYRTMEFTDRTNDYVEGKLGATYTINEYLSAGIDYVKRAQTSDNAAFEFAGNVVSLSLSARY